MTGNIAAAQLIRGLIYKLGYHTGLASPWAIILSWAIIPGLISWAMIGKYLLRNLSMQEVRFAAAAGLSQQYQQALWLTRLMRYS